MFDPVQLRVHAEGIRASQTLGRSPLMHRLFDFLLECSLAGRAPKEIEVGVEVFGKQLASEDPPDAMVRVYIHKLRRKLQEYYAGPGRDEGPHLAIPKGEYRLVFDTVGAANNANGAVVVVASREPAGVKSGGPDPAAADVVAVDAEDPRTAGPVPEIPRPRSLAAPSGSSGRLRRYWIMGLAAAVTLGNVGLWFFTRSQIPASVQEAAQVRQSGVWAPLLHDDLPVYVVIGDYYLFGELDDSGMNVRRLVRDFDINSRDDLGQFLMNQPELSERYMDVSLQYLPVSVAYALRDLLPLLAPGNGHQRQVQVVLASEMTPAMLKSAHVVYVGLLSGLHILRDVAFSGSQFRIGASYDELIDRHSRKLFVSEAGTALDGRTRYRDYGYFSTFEGPNGNRIVILAGTRDVAMMHTADSLSHLAGVQQLERQVHTTSDFEALYAVDALNGTDLDGRLIFAGKLDTNGLWGGSKTAAAQTSHPR
jgi:hypothetical protein